MPVRSDARRFWKRILALAAGWALIVDVALVAFYIGQRHREWTWRQSVTTRFVPDSANEYRNGVEADREGLVNRFDNVSRAAARDRQTLSMDYVPLRLQVFRYWASVTRQKYPQAYAARQWQPQYDFDWRLKFHTALELMGSLGAFLLVRHWVRRADLPPAPTIRWSWRLRRWLEWLPWRRGESLPLARVADVADRDAASPHFRGALPGMSAALLLWFNPAMVQNSHAWVQTDTWVVPFYLWAAFFASAGWWFMAGVVVAVGAMIKGQMALAAAFFIFWPLVGGAPWTAMSCLAGLLLAGGLRLWLGTVAPQSSQAMLAAISGLTAVGFTAALCGVVAITARWAHAMRFLTGLVFASALIVSPWMIRNRALALDALLRDRAILSVWQSLYWPAVWWILKVAACSLLALLVVRLCMRGRWLTAQRGGLVMAGVLGVALLWCIPKFDASTSWLEQGFGVGTYKFQGMVVGPSDNLPALLERRFGWRSRDATLLTIDPRSYGPWPRTPIQVSMKQCLSTIYGITLILCAIAAAVQARRNDRRFLIAVTAPWVLLFALMVQMHERYLLFAAGVGCVCVAVSAGTVLLDLLFSAVSWIMTFAQMLNYGAGGWRQDTGGFSIVSPKLGQMLLSLSNSTFPDLAWAVLLSAAVFLYLAFTPSRPPRRSGPSRARRTPVVAQEPAPVARDIAEPVFAGHG